jgi:TusA-related sulfurtransferase
LIDETRPRRIGAAIRKAHYGRAESMNRKLLAGSVAALLLTGAVSAVAAAEHDPVMDEQLVVALKTEHFEIPETDISHLAVGEKETIVTEYGRTVDLLRTEDGVEVYLDGELLDLATDGEEHVIREEIEILCDTPADCEDVRLMAEDGDLDLEALEADGAHKVIRIHKETEVVGGDVDIELDIETDETIESVEQHGEKVIIIRKKSEDEI